MEDDDDQMDCGAEEKEEEEDDKTNLRQKQFKGNHVTGGDDKARAKRHARKEKIRREFREFKLNRARGGARGGQQQHTWTWIIDGSVAKGADLDVHLIRRINDVKSYMRELIQTCMKDFDACIALFYLSCSDQKVIVEMLRAAWGQLEWWRIYADANLLGRCMGPEHYHIIICILSNLCVDREIAKTGWYINGIPQNVQQIYNNLDNSFAHQRGLDIVVQWFRCGVEAEHINYDFSTWCINTCMTMLERYGNKEACAELKEIWFRLVRSCFILMDEVCMHGQLWCRAWFIHQRKPRETFALMRDYYALLPPTFKPYPLKILKRVMQYAEMSDNVNALLLQNDKFLPFIVQRAQDIFNMAVVNEALIVLDNFVYGGPMYMHMLLNDYNLFQRVLNPLRNNHDVGWNLRSLLCCMVAVAVNAKDTKTFELLVKHYDVFAFIIPNVKPLLEFYEPRMETILVTIEYVVDYDLDWVREHFQHPRIQGMDLLDHLYGSKNNIIHEKAANLLKKIETLHHDNNAIAPQTNMDYFTFG